MTLAKTANIIKLLAISAGEIIKQGIIVMNIVKSKISQLRQERELTQKQLAKAIKVSVKTIARWEDNAARMTPSKIIALVRFFGVTADYLLGMVDD